MTFGICVVTTEEPISALVFPSSYTVLSPSYLITCNESTEMKSTEEAEEKAA